MTALGHLVAGLAGRVVPACDGDVVRAVFACASAGYVGPRHRDGRRVSWLTPSGVPFEASVSGGSGCVDPALRYTTEAATGLPFFGPKLAAQRAALADLTGWLPEPAPELSGFVDLVFPDPTVVPARTRFATSFGVVHRAEFPQHVARLKVYANVGISPGAVARLGVVWRQYVDVAERVAGVAGLRLHFAALEVDADGRRSYKLYFGCREGSVEEIAGRFSVGLDGALWSKRFTICCASDDHGNPTLAFHVPVKALGLTPSALGDLAEKHHGTSGLLDVLPARPTVLGFGLGPAGAERLTIYSAPD